MREKREKISNQTIFKVGSPQRDEKSNEATNSKARRCLQVLTKTTSLED